MAKGTKIPCVDGLWMTIDPGTRYCGWAIWRVSAGAKRGALVDAGIWRANGKDAYGRADSIAAMAGAMILAGRINDVVVERPRHFGGHGRGKAARNSGAILKLMYLVGVLAGRTLALGRRSWLVGVERWKGQLPKAVTQRRVQRSLGTALETLEPGTLARSDVWDALGIGDWLVRKHWGGRFGRVA